MAHFLMTVDIFQPNNFLGIIFVFPIIRELYMKEIVLFVARRNLIGFFLKLTIFILQKYAILLNIHIN